MNETIKQFSLLYSICEIVYFLLPFPIAMLSLSLMSMYMKYYDIGINMTANNGFLYFFVAPVLLIILYITATATLYLVNRFFKSQWLGIVLGSVLMFMVGIGSFILEVQSNVDYPTEEPQNMTLFLKDYISEMGARLSKK